MEANTTLHEAFVTENKRLFRLAVPLTNSEGKVWTSGRAAQRLVEVHQLAKVCVRLHVRPLCQVAMCSPTRRSTNPAGRFHRYFSVPAEAYHTPTTSSAH